MWDNIAREFPVTWKPRSAPLTTVALAGYGVAKYIVLERLRRRSAAELEGLKIVLAQDYFVLFGEKSRLPWASGAVYLGYDPTSPNLLMPVALQPTLPMHLFEHVLRARMDDKSGQVAILPQPLHVIAIAEAKPAMSREVLGPPPSRRLTAQPAVVPA